MQLIKYQESFAEKESKRYKKLALKALLFSLIAFIILISP